MKNYRYDPVVTGLFVGFGVLILWYYSSLAVENKVVPVYFDYIMKFITILIATLVGAFFAFRFNWIIENERQSKLLIENIRHTNFLIAAKLNQLRGIKLNYLDPYEQNKLRWGVMKACAQISEKTDVDFADLSILHDKHPKLLMEIEIAQESYKYSIQILNRRSDLHTEKLQKAQAEYLKSPNSEATYEEFAKNIDDSLREIMQTATDSCYTIIPVTIDLFIENQRAMLDAARKMFPSIEFFDHNEMFENGPT